MAVVVVIGSDVVVEALVVVVVGSVVAGEFVVVSLRAVVVWTDSVVGFDVEIDS